MRAVVVTAHPDDETLWAGGYLAAHSGTDVICCSIPKKDPQRAAHFFEACRLLGANPIVMASSSAENDNKLDLRAVTHFVARYDLILTHNQLGEYGHPHHIQVHEAMTRSYASRVRCFGYGLPGTDHRGELVDIELKRRVLSVYTSRPEVFQRQSVRFNLARELFV